MTLSYRREKLVRIKQKNEKRIAAMLASRRIEGAFNTDVQEIGPASIRLKTPDGTRELQNDYVFVFAGGDPPFELLRRMGIRFGGEGNTAEASATRPPARSPGSRS